MGSHSSKIEQIETLDFNGIAKALSEIDIDEIEARYGEEEFEKTFGLCGNEIGLTKTLIAEDFAEGAGQMEGTKNDEFRIELKMDLKVKDNKIKMDWDVIKSYFKDDGKTKDNFKAYKSLIASVLSTEAAEMIEVKLAEKMKEKTLLQSLHSEDSGQGSENSEDDDSVISSNFPRRYIKSSKVRRGSILPMSPTPKDHPKTLDLKTSGQQRKWRILPPLTRTKRSGLKRHMSVPAGRPMLQRFSSSTPIFQDVQENQHMEDDLVSIDLNRPFEGVSKIESDILEEDEGESEIQVTPIGTTSKSMERTSEWKILPKLIMANRPMLHRFISAPVGIQAFGNDQDDEEDNFLWDYDSVAI